MEICSNLSNQNITVVFALDSIDQLLGSIKSIFRELGLDSVREYSWDNTEKNDKMLDSYPNNVHFIISYSGNYSPEDVHSYSLEQYTTNEEINEVVSGVLKSNGRSISNPVIQAVIEKSRKTPLFTSLVLQRLFLMNINDFVRISKNGDNIQAISEQQIRVIRSLPDELFDIYLNIIHEIGQRINKTLVEKALLYIAFTKNGVTEKDLSVLLKDKWNSLEFAYFITYLNDLFVLRSDGRIDFTNNVIRKGIIQSNNGKMYQIHLELYQYLNSLSSEEYVP
jgi:hypothetical protein